MGQRFVVNKDFENQFSATKHFITTVFGGYSTNKYAEFNLGCYCGEDNSTTAKNKELLCKDLGILPNRLLVPREIHKNKVELVDKELLLQSEDFIINRISEADALITSEKKVAVAVTTADCVPIICTDNKNFVAAIHAGWRGIVANITDNTVCKLKELGCKIENLSFLIGPCIAGKNYEVDENVWNQFCEAFTPEEQNKILEKKTNSKFYPDIRTAVTLQIERHVSPKNIYQFEADTYTDKRFYSARRSGIDTGRFLTGIMLK